MEDTVAAAKAKLYEVRARRVWPGRDEKVLTAWNGLMLRSLAEAARYLDEPEYRELAIRNAEFVLAHLRRDGRLLRTYKDGQAKLNGYLEDYANYAVGLLALYEATFDLRWFAAARQLADTMLTQFWDEASGMFYTTPSDHEALLVRPRDFQDNAVPSGNSVAVEVLLQLALLTGEQRYQEVAERVLRQLGAFMTQHPLAFGELLCALDFHLAQPYEIALVGDPDAPAMTELLDVLYGGYLPNKVVALRRADDTAAAAAIALLRDRDAIGGQPTAYVCHNYACDVPTGNPNELAEQLGLGDD